MTFRTRLFVSSVAAAALTLVVATTLVSISVRQAMEAQIEQSLVDEARLAAETLAHRRHDQLAGPELELPNHREALLLES